MAVAVQSTSVSSFAGYGNVGEDPSVNHPSGLTAGDLMMCFLTGTQIDAGAADDWATPSGWTKVGTQTFNNGTDNTRNSLFYKVADSGDVSAGSTTFDYNISAGDNHWAAAIMYRIDGYSGTPTSNSATVTSDTTPSYAASVTPSVADSLLIIFGGASGDHASGAATGYAIATSDPGGWTEATETYGDSTSFGASNDSDGLLFSAYDVRTETTATGNTSLTLTNFDDSGIFLVAISPQTDVTVNATPLIATGTIPDASVTGDANVSATPIIGTGVLPEETATAEAPMWTNQNENSTTWTNQNKS